MATLTAGLGALNLTSSYKLLHVFRAHYLSDTHKMRHTNFKSYIPESFSCNFLWSTSCCPCRKASQISTLPINNILSHPDPTPNFLKLNPPALNPP